MIIDYRDSLICPAFKDSIIHKIHEKSALFNEEISLNALSKGALEQIKDIFNLRVSVEMVKFELVELIYRGLAIKTMRPCKSWKIFEKQWIKISL